jgi:hypothetical protein
MTEYQNIQTIIKRKNIPDSPAVMKYLADSAAVHQEFVTNKVKLYLHACMTPVFTLATVK